MPRLIQCAAIPYGLQIQRASIPSSISADIYRRRADARGPSEFRPGKMHFVAESLEDCKHAGVLSLYLK